VGDAVKPPIVAGAGVTIKEALPTPLVSPLPVQVSVKVYVPAVVSVRVLTALPSSGFEPLQEPDAVQAVALVVHQVNEAELPATICTGSTLRWTVTGGVCVELLTNTVTVLAVLPPGPEQVST
jgi:hypothetical protein